MKSKVIGILIVMLMIAAILPTIAIGETKINDETAPIIPSSFDLRDVSGESYVTSVKCKSGLTCWIYSIIACMEGNLLITGNWKAAGETGEPNLAEYHLDWWNGFNTFYNDDVPSSDGITPHRGGQCKIAAAYLARGEGAVFSEDANDGTEYDNNWYDTAPNRFDDSYHIYYAHDIEIYDIGENLENINLIKNKIMNYGPINVGFLFSSKYLRDDYTTYQPPNSVTSANHNVAIIGWDDQKDTAAPEDGAWLCENNKGSGWGLDGYFWISYYDKYCCRTYKDAEWVSSYHVEPMSYKRVYYHDYHGWQEDFDVSNEVFNAFTADDNELLSAVSFFTCTNNVQYQVRIFDRYDDGELQDELSSASGTIDFKGFHTIELEQPVHLTSNDQFYIYLELSDGGIPYDQTVTIGSQTTYTIESISHPGESFYYQGGSWHDLYDFDDTANFCIKGLVSKTADLECDDNIEWKNVKPCSTITHNISITNVGEPFSKLNWEVSEWPDWGTWSFSPSESYLYPESGVEIIQVSVVVPDEKNQKFFGGIRITNKDDSDDYELIQISLATPKNKLIYNPFIQFLEDHPHMFPMLRHLLGL